MAEESNHKVLARTGSMGPKLEMGIHGEGGYQTARSKSSNRGKNKSVNSLRVQKKRAL